MRSVRKFIFTPKMVITCSNMNSKKRWMPGKRSSCFFQRRFHHPCLFEEKVESTSQHFIWWRWNSELTSSFSEKRIFPKKLSEKEDSANRIKTTQVSIKINIRCPVCELSFWFDSVRIITRLRAWNTSVPHIPYYFRNFCNLIGLEQWSFSLIWNTYMLKLQNLSG